MQDGAVHVYIGGVCFVTNRSTLMTTPFFASLLDTTPDTTEVFVDRDPTHFRYVLNWMRGVRYVPDDDATIQELRWEADYYGMRDLAEVLTRCKHYFSAQRSLHQISTDLKATLQRTGQGKSTNR